MEHTGLLAPIQRRNQLRGLGPLEPGELRFDPGFGVFGKELTKRTLLQLEGEPAGEP